MLLINEGSLDALVDSMLHFDKIESGVQMLAAEMEKLATTPPDTKGASPGPNNKIRRKLLIAKFKKMLSGAPVVSARLGLAGWSKVVPPTVAYTFEDVEGALNRAELSDLCTAAKHMNLDSLIAKYSSASAFGSSSKRLIIAQMKPLFAHLMPDGMRWEDAARALENQIKSMLELRNGVKDPFGFLPTFAQVVAPTVGRVPKADFESSKPRIYKPHEVHVQRLTLLLVLPIYICCIGDHSSHCMLCFYLRVWRAGQVEGHRGVRLQGL